MTPLQEALRAYLDHLSVERGLAANTLSSYRRDLRRYLAHLAGRDVGAPGDVTEADVTAFLVALREGDAEHPPLAAISAARAVVAVRGFHRFLLREGLTAVDPARGVRPPAPAKRLPKAITVEDVEALLAAAGADETPRAVRDRALLELLYGSGARISEAVGLDVDELDLSSGTVRLMGKGSKERVVPLGSYAREAVSAYLVRSRPGLVAAGPGVAGAVPERARRAAVAAERLDGAAGRGGPGRAAQGDLAPHAAALVRHPPARRRRRRTRRAGAAGPRLGDHHAGLHARHGRQAPRGLRDRPPPRPLTARSS